MPTRNQFLTNMTPNPALHTDAQIASLFRAQVSTTRWAASDTH